ncbi:hypothetical protein K4K59_005904 [Colletotrichum sp. SAR11_240]|nr:hypothetical protein K4K59_005904 [Colletotrichum sp. SAR11_240]
MIEAHAPQRCPPLHCNAERVVYARQESTKFHVKRTKLWRDVAEKLFKNPWSSVHPISPPGTIPDPFPRTKHRAIRDWIIAPSTSDDGAH